MLKDYINDLLGLLQTSVDFVQTHSTGLFQITLLIVLYLGVIQLGNIFHELQLSRMQRFLNRRSYSLLPYSYFTHRRRIQDRFVADAFAQRGAYDYAQQWSGIPPWATTDIRTASRYPQSPDNGGRMSENRQGDHLPADVRISLEEDIHGGVEPGHDR